MFKSILYAILYLTALLAAAPAQAQASLDQAQCGNKGRDISPDLAIAACSRLIQYGSLTRADLGIVYIDRGSAYDDQGEHDQAIADYTNALELDPRNAVGYFIRGIAYDAKGEHDLAIADYTKAIELEPSQPGAYAARGVDYARKGDYEKAIVDFSKEIELDADATTYAARGAAYSSSRQYDLAIADYAKALELDPRNPDAYRSRGFAYEEKGEYDLAIADHTKAIELNPRDPGAYGGRGVAYSYKGEYDLAIADYTKAIELSSDLAVRVDGYYNRGSAYGHKGEYDRSIADLNQALELNPKNALAFTNRGTAYHLLGENDLAIADYSKALELDPNLVEAYIARGVVNELEGKLDPATADFKKAVDVGEKVRGKDHPSVGIVRANLGGLYKYQGKLDEAEPLLKSALETTKKAFGPNHASVAYFLVQLGDLLRLENKCNEAEPLFDQARAINPAPFVRVLFGTDRKKDDSKPSPAFGAERSDNGNVYGRAVVTVPDAQALLIAALPDYVGGRIAPVEVTDEQRLALGCIKEMDNQQMIKEANEGKQALVFVHGYNVSFEDAMRRAAQIAHDIQFDGDVFLFSWPSKASSLGYLADLGTAQFAASHLEEFIEKVVAQSKVTKVHFIAHSMGNLVLLNALAELAGEHQNLRPLIGEVIDAAPDVDPGVFAQFATKIKKAGANLTLYAARSDKALSASSFLRFGLPQAGFINGKPLIVRDEVTGDIVVDTIDITNGGTAAWYDLFALDHDIYSSNPIIIRDLKHIIAHERPPNKRTPEFEEVPSSGGTYWRLRSREAIARQ